MSRRRPLSELVYGLIYAKGSGKILMSQIAAWANEHKDVLNDDERELFKKGTSKEEYLRSIALPLKRLLCDLSEKEQKKHDVMYWITDASKMLFLDRVSKTAFGGNGFPVGMCSQADPKQLNLDENEHTTLKPPAQPADDAPIREFVGWLHRLVSFAMELQ